MIDDSELRDLDPFALMDAEAARLDAFLGGLGGAEWLEPTRCAGWRRRELLAHLAASEEYNHATLDGTVPALIERATQAGASGLDAFNQWGVDLRRDRTPEELLAEWREVNGTTRRRMRERGWDGTLKTFVGDYPAGLQSLHLAIELCVHADDMDVPLPDDERRRRAQWQPRFARFTVREYERAVEIQPDPQGNNRLSADGVEAMVVDDATLVAAASARLPQDHPMPQQLRDLLKVFA